MKATTRLWTLDSEPAESEIRVGSAKQFYGVATWNLALAGLASFQTDQQLQQSGVWRTTMYCNSVSLGPRSRELAVSEQHLQARHSSCGVDRVEGLLKPGAMDALA